MLGLGVLSESGADDYHIPQTRFNVPYMHCGCPLPGETIGQKLNRLMGSASKQSPSYLVPPDDEDLLAGTHPSDHNAVFSFQHKAMSDAARKKRAAKFTARKERDLALARKGKGHERGESTSRAGESGRYLHGAAFLLPIPIYFAAEGFGGCFAYGGAVDGHYGGCAAVSLCFFYYAVCMKFIALCLSVLGCRRMCSGRSSLWGWWGMWIWWL
jgi:hypothetical protein